MNKQPIRILHVLGRMGMGGTETMLMNLYRNIDREQIQFDFMVHTEEETYYDKEIYALGGKIYRVPRFRGYNIIPYVRTLVNFFRQDTEHKIIHGHIGSSAAIYLAIANHFNRFTIAHSHCANSAILTVTVKDIFFKFFSFPTRYIAQFFFGCSKAAGMARYGKRIVMSDKFTLLNNAIETDKFIFKLSIREEIRARLKIENNFVVGHVGRFNEQKNHNFLIDIFSEIYKKNKNAVLLLVGDGDMRAEITEKINRLGLTDNVIFTGIQANVNELMMAMDVFVFPSLFEGLPVVLIEAQATGLTCFVSDIVPSESKISDLLTFIPLKLSPTYWGEQVCACKLEADKRNNMKQIITSAGYDIATTIEWLQNFYTAIDPEGLNTTKKRGS